MSVNRSVVLRQRPRGLPQRTDFELATSPVPTPADGQFLVRICYSSLDPATRLDMQDLLVRLWREVEATVLFVTHSVEEAVYLGDRVFVMATTPGRIIDEVRMPAASAPARDTQSQAWFHEQVNALQARIEQVEAAAKRPNGVPR